MWLLLTILYYYFTRIPRTFKYFFANIHFNDPLSHFLESPRRRNNLMDRPPTRSGSNAGDTTSGGENGGAATNKPGIMFKIIRL